MTNYASQLATEQRDTIAQFLSETQFSDYTLSPISADWGARHYFRLSHKTEQRQTALVMVCEDEVNRKSLPAFVAISEKLRSVNISAPEVYKVDEAQGLALVEDFGDVDYALALERDILPKSEIYNRAAQILMHLGQRKELAQDLPDFFETPVYKGHIRALDWFVPSRLNHKNDPKWRDQYLSIWESIEAKLPEAQKGFTHIDYHPGNMMYLPERTAIRQCGLLDFQGACFGPLAYDYTNLLKDIRHDVPQLIEAHVLVQATDKMTSAHSESFMAWYRFLCVQFHLRIVGQVIKIAHVMGRDDLLGFLPRVTGYLSDELRTDEFHELATFFHHIGVDFKNADITLDKSLIAENAF